MQTNNIILLLYLFGLSFCFLPLSFSCAALVISFCLCLFFSSLRFATDQPQHITNRCAMACHAKFCYSLAATDGSNSTACTQQIFITAKCSGSTVSLLFAIRIVRPRDGIHGAFAKFESRSMFSNQRLHQIIQICSCNWKIEYLHRLILARHQPFSHFKWRCIHFISFCFEKNRENTTYFCSASRYEQQQQQKERKKREKVKLVDAKFEVTH